MTHTVYKNLCHSLLMTPAWACLYSTRLICISWHLFAPTWAHFYPSDLICTPHELICSCLGSFVLPWACLYLPGLVCTHLGLSVLPLAHLYPPVFVCNHRWHSVQICDRYVDNIMALYGLRRASGRPPDCTWYMYNMYRRNNS